VIRRLRLTSWRNYADIDLSIDRGTTFIVAPNGIGKTSLMEAASWAMFGDFIQRPRDAVRVGATSARATAEVELPDDHRMTITRTLPKRPTAAIPPPVIHLDGEEVEEAAIRDTLHQLYSADLAFLARLAMPSGSLDRAAPSDLGLHGHLCKLFGVDKLLTASQKLEQRIKTQEKLIREAKQGAPGSADVISALETRVAVEREAYERITATHRKASDRLARVHKSTAAREQVSRWRERASAYEAALAEFSKAVSPHVAQDSLSPEAIEKDLQSAWERSRNTLEGLIAHRAALEGEARTLTQHVKTLENSQDSHGDCPVCRRPLDGETARSAVSAHNDQLSRIAVDIDRFRAEEYAAKERQGQLSELVKAFHAIERPGPSPEQNLDDLDANESPADLDAHLKRLMSELLERKGALDQAERELGNSRNSASAYSRVQRLYTEEGTLRAAHAAITATTRKVLDDTIQPLANEVSVRWQQMFPGRGRLRTLSTGEVTRDVNGENLPFSAFSTGERAGLVLFLRLLVLETATKADFCWFDEPLEHLAPDARRRVAETLARASIAGPIKQIVVTTYEEPLARRLQERDPANVNLIYVRQTPEYRDFGAGERVR
jgi:DNA repair exonuclease SbcCD ATPase subunit